MALIDIQEVTTQHEWERSFEGNTGLRVYHLVYDSPPVGGAAFVSNDLTVVNSISLPAAASFHPQDTLAFVLARAAKPLDDDNLVWEVRVRYGRPTVNFTAGTSPGAGGSAPTAGPSGSGAGTMSPVEVSYGFVDVTVPATTSEGGLIRNSAGDPFAPQPTKEESRFEATLTYNVYTMDLTWLEESNNKVNNAAFVISGRSFAIKTLRAKLSASSVSQNGANWWRVQVKIQHNPKGWDTKIEDAGMRYLEGGVAGKLRSFPGTAIGPNTLPQRLKANGDKAAPGDPTNFITVAQHTAINFNTLFLGW